ncbi:MAG: carbamate kinase [Oscillospiraceae bacterium]|nr:carbamate kinase [Oscillospiraceae bacterium]
MPGRIVIALGGNALGNTPEEQKQKIENAAPALVGLISQGYEIIVSHGNGPQVGMINLAFAESSKFNEKIPPIDLPECTAMSQGYIGYHLQNGIKRELRREGMPWNVASMITQVIVDENDPAFNNPTKPIGAYYTEEEARALMAENPSQTYREDAGRGWRRMVASPAPCGIVERDSILNLLDNEFIVIACGGGGIPVIRRGDGDYEGVAAVIDKDFASAYLAEACDADYLFILTAVSKVAINWGESTETFLDKMSVAEAEKYCEEGHFAPGSMLPKVRAAIHFAKSKIGRRAIIADLNDAPLAIRGLAGTEIYAK